MRAVSVFPLDEFRLALKKVYGAAAPKGPFTALSQATLFFSRNSCTIACCNLNQWCQATIPAQGDEFSLTLYDTQRLLDACAYFSGELHLEYETAEKKPHNCDIPYNQARFSCGGREIHQLVFDSDLYPLPKEFQPEQVYQINAGTVFGLFTQVRHAVSSDTNRPWSCCVQFTDHRMYALDGYRLSVRTIPDFEAAKPFQILEEAMELLSVFADEDCTLSIGREWLSVQNDSKRLITRVPPSGGLKLDSTIPTIFTEERWIDVEGTRNDLKYLLKMENKKLRAPLRLGDGWLSVRGNSGLYRAELRMERPPAIVIGYDPRYLLDAFDAFAKRGIKTARMSFTSPVGPTVLTADNGFTELILPVRLKPEEATTYIPPRKQVAYPRLRADLSLYKTPYPDFPIPRLVFGFSVGAADGAVSACRIGVIADETPTPDTIMYRYPFSNVDSSGSLCIGANTLPKYKELRKAAGLPALLISIPNNFDRFDPSDNQLGLDYRDLMQHLKDKEPAYYYTDILIPNGQTLAHFIQRM